MIQTDPRVDVYILKSASFAIPILEHLRWLVHESCPEVTETMKWSFPHFEYKKSILCSMAAFKQHCAFSFWLGGKLTDPDKLLSTGSERTSMGELGRITKPEDLPSNEQITAWIQEEMQLIDAGVKMTRETKPREVKELLVPDYVTEALSQNAEAMEHFKQFTYSGKKDYVEWFEEAKTEATRYKRLMQAMEWISEGKTRHWKYAKK